MTSLGKKCCAIEPCATQAFNLSSHPPSLCLQYTILYAAAMTGSECSGCRVLWADDVVGKFR